MSELPPLVERDFARAFQTTGDLRQAIEQVIALHPDHAHTLRARASLADRRWTMLGLRGEPDAGNRLGRFELQGELGRGAMGVVFRAFDPDLRRHVAIKCMRWDLQHDAKYRERFRREGMALSRLQHPNLGSVHEIGDADGIPFLVMPFVDGETLADHMSAPDRPYASALVLVPLIEKVARGVQYAHERGIVHRDIKPANIVVDEQGEPVLTDFGLANDRDTTFSLTGEQPVGTPAFMAPEQLCATEPVTAATDVWALGVTLYACLAGRLPFRATTPLDLSNAILNSDPAPLHRVQPGAPRDLSIIISTAIAKEPSRRYQSAQELADDLLRLREHRPIRARRQRVSLRLRRWIRRNPLPTVLLVVTAALGIAAILSRKAALESLHGFNTLAIGPRLEEAILAERFLYPAAPKRIPAMHEWIRKYGVPLAAELPRLAQTRQRMRSRGRVIPAQPKLETAAAASVRGQLADVDWEIAIQRDRLRDGHTVGTTRTAERGELARLSIAREQLLEMLDPGERVVFSDRHAQFLYDRVAELHDRIVRFAKSKSGLLARVRERLAWAAGIQRRSIDDHWQVWNSAVQAIRRHEQYDGLTLKPQLGLVPLGPDRRSHLWEFAHLRSGELPTRDPTSGELELTDTSCIVFVLLPAAVARVGAQRDDANKPHYDRLARRNEWVTDIALDAFFIAKHEITQAQWIRLTGGDNPSRYHRHREARHPTPRNPVERVSWTDANAVLTQHGLTLPHEIQWEYACRGTTSTPWSFGNDPTALREFANVVDLRAHESLVWDTPEAWDDGHWFHAPVGSFAPNAFGLHDMHGNVEEWCADRYARYERARAGDGAIRRSGSDMRVVRGGSYQRGRDRARSARRHCDSPGVRTDERGLRAARRIDGKR